MDSFEVNKILGAVLGTCTFVLALAIGSEIIFERPAPEKPGYDLPAPEEAAPQQAAGGGEQPPPIAVRLASADPGKGEAASKQCGACHTFDKGGANKVGPNLYGAVGRDKGGVDGFGYSATLKGAEGNWTFEDLDKFLENPRGYLPGTSMSFAGIKRPDQRADVVAYLNKTSDSPQPLPEAPAGGAPAQAPAGGQPAAGAQAAPAATGQTGQPAPPAQQDPQPRQQTTSGQPGAPAESTQPAQQGGQPSPTNQPQVGGQPPPVAGQGQSEAVSGGGTLSPSVPQPESQPADTAPTPPTGAAEGGTPELPQGSGADRAPVQPSAGPTRPAQ